MLCVLYPLISIINILQLSAAVLFFSVSTFFELLCVLLYAFVFPKLPIVKYYRAKAASEGSKTVAGDLAAGGVFKHEGSETKVFYFSEIYWALYLVFSAINTVLILLILC